MRLVLHYSLPPSPESLFLLKTMDGQLFFFFGLCSLIAMFERETSVDNPYSPGEIFPTNPGRKVEAIFKEPVTAGDFSKKSARGIPIPNEDFYSGHIRVLETLNPRMLDKKYNEACVFQKVFNGDLLIDDTFDAIRKRVRTRDWSE